MSDNDEGVSISVIGTGYMGAALANALLVAGFTVRVWNRTVSKTEQLVEKGAIPADSPEDAIRRSQHSIICVSDYEACLSVMDNNRVVKAFTGKHLLQLGVLAVAEAQKLANWAQSHDIAYLEGSILGTPYNVSIGAATVVCSGPRQLYDKQQSILQAFGNPLYLSDAIGSAFQFDKIMYPFGYGATLGIIQGAAMAKASGFSIEAYTSALLEWVSSLPGKVQNYCSLLDKEDFSPNQATLEVWVDAYAKSLEYCQQIEVDDTLLKAHFSMMNKAVTEGCAKEEILAVYKTLLTPYR